MLSAAKHLATRRVRPFPFASSGLRLTALRVTLVGSLSDAYNALPKPGRDKSRSYAPIDDPHHLFIFITGAYMPYVPGPRAWLVGSGP